MEHATVKKAWCQKENVKKKTGFVAIILTLLFRTWEFVSDTIFWLLYRNAEKTNLPPFENPLLLESATSLATKIRTQKVSFVHDS